jgi:hypothetical protein
MSNRLSVPLSLMRHIVSKNKGYFTPSERELPLLRYYANSIAHFF